MDEIGDIPLAVQNRLLRAIEEKQIKRLGTNHYQAFDVQIIAATSRLLTAMVRDGQFREDLYYRLAVLSLEASPLRERREDFPAMIDRFLFEAADAISEPSQYRTPYAIDEDASVCVVRKEESTKQNFTSLAREGDIILPFEVCILRRGETFKQWTARAKRCSIEAARQATGGTMSSVARRLGLTCHSLKSHLQRAKRVQKEALFDWRREDEWCRSHNRPMAETAPNRHYSSIQKCPSPD